MKALNLVLSAILYLALAACGLALILLFGTPQFLDPVRDWLYDVPPWIPILAGSLLLVLLAAVPLTGALARRHRQFITFENESGRVTVDTDAVSRYLLILRDEFAAIVWLKPRVRVAHGALQVGMALGVRAGTQITELCKLLQARTKEILEEHLGTCDLDGIALEVDEIRSGASRKPVEGA
ncbi:MAG: hypothetical protein IJT88_00235 [Kiritimatiellae bacterium]|nr:hypothetical protein [Kiritimatiellia bacterium]